MIESTYYNDIDSNIKEDISRLINAVWASDTSDNIEIHSHDVKAQSFYIYRDNRIISYAGVIQLEIKIMNEIYIIAGLSTVVTHPEYRNMGYAKNVVREATKWIKKKNKFDFGVFTCEPSLVEFYMKAGDWNVESNVVLVGNENPKSMTSLNLNVVVLMMLISKKANNNKNIIKNARINLNLPKNEFL